MQNALHLKNLLWFYCFMVVSIIAVPLMAQQKQNSDYLAIRDAATTVLENNRYLTVEQRKLLQSAQKANQWTPQNLSDFKAATEKLNNAPNSPIGAPCTDALLQCEAECNRQNAGSNCFVLCNIAYTDCIANITKNNNSMIVLPVNTVKKK